MPRSAWGQSDSGLPSEIPELVAPGRPCRTLPADLAALEPMAAWVRESAHAFRGLPLVLMPTSDLRALTATVLGLEPAALAVDAGCPVAFDWPLDPGLQPRCASLGTLDWPPKTTGGRAGFPSGPAATVSPSTTASGQRPRSPRRMPVPGRAEACGGWSRTNLSS